MNHLVSHFCCSPGCVRVHVCTESTGHVCEEIIVCWHAITWHRSCDRRTKTRSFAITVKNKQTQKHGHSVSVTHQLPQRECFSSFCPLLESCVRITHTFETEKSGLMSFCVVFRNVKPHEIWDGVKRKEEASTWVWMTKLNTKGSNVFRFWMNCSWHKCKHAQRQLSRCQIKK